MKTARTALAAIFLTALSPLAAPASAAELAIKDPAGDAANRGLDITRVKVRNLDHAVVVRVRFVESVRGDVIVSVDPRKATGLRLVSEHRPAAEDRTAVLGSAFTDRNVPKQPPTCERLRVRWSAEAPVVTLRMPSTCLHGGDYGAIRVAVLTERRGDTDYAPRTATAASGWVARG